MANAPAPTFSRTAARLAGAFLLLLLAGCAAPEPPQVRLAQADVLPLAINPDFQFRKETQFLNDPATFQKLTQYN